MRTTPGSDFESNRRRDATSALIAWYGLVVISCCAALVAVSLMFVSLRLSGEMVAANPYCFTPAGHVRQIIDSTHLSLLAGGVASALSCLCAFIASRSSSAAKRGTRRLLLILSTLAILGTGLAVGVYYVWSYAGCFG